MRQLILIAGVVLVAAISAVPTAQARVDDPFTPELFVPTMPIEPDPIWSFPGAYPNSAAGAHPDLVIGMRKPENRCPDADGDGIPDQQCRAIDLFMEQNLKKQVIHFPPGLMADFNATPHCVPEQRWSPMPAMNDSLGLESLVWFCDADSVVGTVKADIAACYRNPNLPEEEYGSGECLAGLNGDDSILLRDWPGAVYNAHPRPGEQGHLIALVPNDPYLPEEDQSFFGGWLMIDFSVPVRMPGTGVDLVADSIPDMLDIAMRNENGDPLNRFQFPIQIARLDMALYGSTGEETGHPFLTNSTFCKPQSIDVLFQGYKRNSADPPGDLGKPIPGSGDGKIVIDSAPSMATNCEAFSYNHAPITSAGTNPSPGPSAAPKFNVKLSDRRKGKLTALELDLSTKERHIKKVSFGLPRDMSFSTRRLGGRRSVGRLRLVTRKGKLESPLRLSKTRWKKSTKKVIRFSTKGALSALKLRLFKKVRPKKKKKKRVFENRLSLKPLPKREIKGLILELNDQELRFIRNPRICKRPLKFLAFVKTSDGKRHVLIQRVRLKGKGCGKKGKSKKGR